MIRFTRPPLAKYGPGLLEFSKATSRARPQEEKIEVPDRRLRKLPCKGYYHRYAIINVHAIKAATLGARSGGRRPSTSEWQTVGGWSWLTCVCWCSRNKAPHTKGPPGLGRFQSSPRRQRGPPTATLVKVQTPPVWKGA